MGELPLTCVGLDRACCRCLEDREIGNHMRSTGLGVRVRCWCDPEGDGSRAGGLSLHGWWVQGTGRMLCWVLDAALLPAGAARLEDTGAIIVSAGFLIGWQKEGTQYAGWHVSLVEMCFLKQHDRAFFSVLVSRLFRGG